MTRTGSPPGVANMTTKKELERFEEFVEVIVAQYEQDIELLTQIHQDLTDKIASLNTEIEDLEGELRSSSHWNSSGFSYD